MPGKRDGKEWPRPLGKTYLPRMVHGHEPRSAETDAWGIENGFRDAMGTWRETSVEIRDALRAAMGPLEDKAPAASSSLPEAAPCPPPPSRRSWGWALQLYSLRSSGSWGIGDLADLRRFGAWASNQGARFLQVNPLMAAQPVPPLEASPYFPCSRRFLNPVYIRIEEVPGFAGAGAELEALSASGHALNGKPLIDRDAVFRLKQAALEALWERGQRTADSRGLERFVADSGRGLREFAAFCVIAETHGNDWRKWPEELRHPAHPAVADFMEARRDRVAFHQWVQWLLDDQLSRAGEAIPLLQDLPIGFDPGGADAWAWQDLLAKDAVVGAPPDEFNRQGQNWGLPPFIPHKLRAAGYAPLRETLRSVLRHAGGLRVDHVLGLFRLWWIPGGADAGRGAYVRYEHREMLAAVAEEARRAHAYVVGEDLGTVEPGVRETLARWRILGTRVLWFEDQPPSSWPEGTLGTLTTHDLPTLAGLWSGADVEEQRSIGLHANADATVPVLHRLRSMAGLPAKAERREVIRTVHRLLSEAGSSLIAACLEDALAVERRPNLPGTWMERPNWRIPLPLPLEAIETDPMVLEVAAAMDRRP